MEDMAILTGGKAFFESLGVKLENIELADLGRAKKVIIDKENTTIIEGAGATSDIQARIKQIETEYEKSTSDYDVKNCKSVRPSWSVASRRSASVEQPRPKSKRRRCVTKTL